MLPTNAVMDSSTGDIYIADYGNYAVKVVYGNTGRNAILEHDVSSRSSKLVSEVSTDLSKPLGLETDEDCNSLYIADSANHRVLKYAFGATPAITTVIGTGAPGKSDSSATATTFQIDSPSAVALNGDILYVVDSGNKRVLAVNLVDQSVEIFDGSAADSSIVFERPVSAAIAQTEVCIKPEPSLTIMRLITPKMWIYESEDVPDAQDGEVLVVADAASRALRKIDLQTKTAALLVDYTAWRSFVVEEAETSIAATGLEHAFYGVSSFFGVRPTSAPE
ncbi:hypothetical protein ETH_00023615 [Eimeria tenella]|uniref:NHL repeat-containing protein n=1 Tax=Eimeria tenella TaxID=5802 RepID=U6KW46_EIMTE|nr:hypothetical protein ETH_00023615 [Eimeria tenella]CDJ42191.1 hypothetical protein ETH_00023615 [Eimeria tenella]|eukprot:XP_013232941.1 hypothetical protein ETH_00023615 [Eimeria tenella]